MLKHRTYWCCISACGYSTQSSILLHGTVCPKCHAGVLDDWPSDAAIGACDEMEDESSLAYFNRYVAGD